MKAKNNYKKPYDEKFRREAVEYLYASEKSQEEVAKELGVSSYSLIAWKKRYYGDPSLKRPDSGEMSEGEKDRELARLRKENEYLKRQREILKKAAAILSAQEENGWR